MITLTLKSVRAHGRRLLGTFIAVFVGVAFLGGTLVMGDTLRANFDELFTTVNANTDVVVRASTNLEADGPRGLIDSSLVDKVEAVDGVASAEGGVEGFGQLIGADGDVIGGGGPPQFAGSWIENPDLNPYRLAEGRVPRADDEVVVNRGAAEEGDLQIGDRTTVRTPEPVEVTIVGLSTFGDADGLGAVTYTAFTLEGAMRHVTNAPNRLTSIAVAGEPGVDEAGLAERVAGVLPGGVEALTGDARTTEMNDDIASDFLDVFTTFLTVFAGIALLVATFSIYNTFSIIVAQRTREGALLRALGAGRRQILSSVVSEALLVGVVASGVGLAGGVGIAVLLDRMFSAFGFPFPDGGVVFQASTAIIGMVVGLAVTLVAGLVPAVKASRVRPLAALRDVAIDRSGVSRRRLVMGAVLTGAGVSTALAAVSAGGDAAMAPAGLGALLTVVGVVVLGPVVARPVTAVLGAPVARLRGVTGDLARSNAMRNPRRTAGTAAALMVGLGVVTLFTVFAASIKASLDDSVSRSFGGDLVVSSGVFSDGELSPRMSSDIDALPEVQEVVPVSQGSALLDDEIKRFSVADPKALAGVLDLDVTAGSVAELGGSDIAISDATADSNGWELGDPLRFTFADGAEVALTVGAIYETTDIVGGYVMPRSVWDSHVVQRVDQLVMIDLAKGTSLADGKAAVERVAETYGGPDVQDRDEFASSLSSGVDMFLGVVYALLALAILIAGMGIANTLSLSVHERTRELGLLRAVGQTRAQVRSLVRWESVIVAVFGAVGGVGLGVFLGWVLVQAAGASGGFDAFAVPPAQLLIVLVVGAMAGVLAAVRPGRRAARLDVLEAIATE